MATPNDKQAPKRAVTRAIDWKPRFLRELTRSGLVRIACLKARIHKDTAYEHRKSDPGFAMAWREALATFVETCEAEVDRRAFRGTKKPIYQQGKKVGEVREYSDQLAMFRLRALRPDKYRDNAKVEHAGSVKHTHDARPLVQKVFADPAAYAAAKALRERLAGVLPPNDSGN